MGRSHLTGSHLEAVEIARVVRSFRPRVCVFLGVRVVLLFVFSIPLAFFMFCAGGRAPRVSRGESNTGKGKQVRPTQDATRPL